MPLNFSSQHKIPQLPIWTATMDFDLVHLRQDYFPPSGFLYLNMFALTGKQRAPDITPVNSAGEFSMHWKIDLHNGLVKSCQIVAGGILTKGPALMESVGSGQWAVLVLHPVIAYYFMRERLDMVTNGFADLRDLMGKAGELFKHPLEDGYIHSWEDEPVLQFLLKRVGQQNLWKDDPIFHAVNLIIQKKGLIRVRELAAQVL